MKVLLINTVPTEPNGITNVIFNYQSHVSPSKITFDYVSINRPSPKYINLIQEKKGLVFFVERSAKRIFHYIIQLKNIIKKNKYDIVHIHTNSHTVVLDLLASKWGGCPIRIVHVHNTTCNSVLLHKLLTPLFNALYTHGLACGEDAGHWMFGGKPFKVLNNGVDTEVFSFSMEKRREIRKKNSIGDDEMVIGHVGLFNEQKNHSFLIEVFKELNHRESKYKLMLIGDGNLRKDIERKVTDYKMVEKVIFTGNINNVSDYLNAIDLIVMPSLFEGLPLSLIEQQANGLQCVVADTITKEADKTGNMIFFPLEAKPQMWADRILGLKLEDDRTKQSQAAIKKIKACGYSIQEEALKLKRFYINICDTISKY